MAPNFAVAIYAITFAVLALMSSAQFNGFFDNMFGGQQHHQHQQQQRPAGSAYYSAQADAGMSDLLFLHTRSNGDVTPSPMLELPLPWYIHLC
jgi:hypothetical protein